MLTSVETSQTRPYGPEHILGDRSSKELLAYFTALGSDLALQLRLHSPGP
jgi:hypothetical protein